MATERFPKTQRWKVPATDETVFACAFTVPENQMPRYLRLVVLNKGVASGQFRVAFYSDRALTKLYAATNWRAVSDIAEEVGGFGSLWRGVWGFEFPSPYPRLAAGRSYYMAVEQTGYTRAGLTTFVAFSLDEPFEINDQDGTSKSLAFELYSYRRVGNGF